MQYTIVEKNVIIHQHTTTVILINSKEHHSIIKKCTNKMILTKLFTNLKQQFLLQNLECFSPNKFTKDTSSTTQLCQNNQIQLFFSSAFDCHSPSSTVLLLFGWNSKSFFTIEQIRTAPGVERIKKNPHKATVWSPERKHQSGRNVDTQPRNPL